MDEAVLFPSPNWFLNSNFAVSTDGWLVYGGPSKSICVLEPRLDENGVISGKNRYRAHVAPRAHYERVVSVDISSEFPEKRNFLSGSQDGTVKQWTLEKVHDVYKKIKTTHTHEIHFNESEEIAGVGYSTPTIAISVGCLGNVVKWDLTSNVCRTYSKFLSNFKANCMTCSPHVPYQVAIGTKQGIVFVLDLQSNLGKIVYKVRSQDDEIICLSWCPQYELLVNKVLKETVKKSTATSRLEAIRNIATEPETDNVLEQSVGVKNQTDNVLEQSGVVKNLPEDSFDETVVEEDDMFDIYKDHEADEFGHKKYEPEDIIVKLNEEKSGETDYLAECMKLKEEILMRKNGTEQSIESLVEAMDKTHVTKASNVESSESNASGSCVTSNQGKKSLDVHSAHPHKHLLATIGKYGSVRIWSKSGKMVASCALQHGSKNTKNKVSSWPAVLWYKPDTLLMVDAKSQLVECNPLKIDSKNKMEIRPVHSHHKRGLFAIVSDAPRVQKAYDSPESPDFLDSQNWSVYTVSQDRNIVRYNMTSKKVAIHNSCGGFLYNIQPCPYDAGKIAISVGDGAVRVWQTSTVAEDENKLYPGKITTFWQNVQGKVLTVAWHPSKENLLAFGTGESRVGIIDTTGKNEKPARVLYPALNGGVYSLSWGEDMNLYTCAGATLFMYNAAKDEAPKEIDVIVEGQKWNICATSWSSRGLVCGAVTGPIAVLDVKTYEPLAVSYVFSKMIHMMDWHPEQTSNSNEESPYKNLIAVSSLEKNSHIAILEYKDKEGGGKELSTWKILSGHKLPVLQIMWNPHSDHLLLSTSQDTTIRVWDVTSGECISIFGGHSQHTLGATWLSMPQFESKILSGGGDCCLRLWDYKDFKPENYEKLKHDTSTKSKKGEKKKSDESTEDSEQAGAVYDKALAANTENKRKPSKRFMLPLIHKQINPGSYIGLKKMYEKYVERGSGDSETKEYGCEFIKIFGTINEINEVLDWEMEHLQAENLTEAWITLAMFRGQVDAMIQFAKQRDLLCPYILNLTPCVSFKFWKEASQLYLAQIDRLIAKSGEDQLIDNRFFGGPIYRKMTTLLSVHDILGAVKTLTEARMFKEAYILCRLRYMDSIAEQTLRAWAKDSCCSGNMRVSAICYMALGDLKEAAVILSKFPDQETLSLAADLAKMAGINTFADHVEKRAQTSISKNSETTEEILEGLPSRIELLMKEKSQNKDVAVENGDGIDNNQGGDS